MIITQLKSDSFQSVKSPTECSHVLEKKWKCRVDFHFTEACVSQSHAPHGAPKENAMYSNKTSTEAILACNSNVNISIT